MAHEAHVDLITDPTDAELAAAGCLLEKWSQAEGLALPLPLLPPSDEMVTTVLAVAAGRPVGIAALPTDPAPEASLIVDPAARRRGVGRALVAALRREAARRALPGFLLVADEDATAGRPFATAIGATYRFSEFQLALREEAVVQPESPDPALEIRRATAADLEHLARIRAAAFAEPLAEARAGVWRGLQETRRFYLIASLAGTPVGMVRLGEWDGNGDITSLAVLPAHQGRGIGRRLLREAVARLRERAFPRILIEVATENTQALGLYRSCGFVPVKTYAYFRCASDVSP